MDNFIMIDGKKYRLVPEETQEEPAKEEPVKKLTGYERAALGQKYFLIGEFSEPNEYYEENAKCDDEIYDTGNYYTDEKIANDNARADRLMHRLRRYAVEHGGMIPRKHLQAEEQKYFICCGEGGMLYADSIYGLFADFGTIYFCDEDSAQQAIEAFRPELEWYFTEYEPKLI